MSTMTLSGREAPSTKRIDVEANLLQEWLQERRDMKKHILLRLVGVAGAAVLSVWTFTTLNECRAGFVAKQAPVSQRLKAIQSQYSAVLPAAGGATSNSDVRKMVEASKVHADAYIGQVISLMNSSSASMALASLKVDVLAGEVKITGQADAETYYAAGEFIQRNNDLAKGMSASQVSTTRSDVLATDGVSFQFVKKVRVAQ